MDELFRQGGPHNIRKPGRDQYTMNISLPADADGAIGRECPDAGWRYDQKLWMRI